MTSTLTMLFPKFWVGYMNLFFHSVWLSIISKLKLITFMYFSFAFIYLCKPTSSYPNSINYESITYPNWTANRPWLNMPKPSQPNLSYFIFNISKF